MSLPCRSFVYEARLMSFGSLVLSGVAGLVVLLLNKVDKLGFGLDDISKREGMGRTHILSRKRLCRSRSSSIRRRISVLEKTWSWVDGVGASIVGNVAERKSSKSESSLVIGSSRRVFQPLST